ncbi:hypothetical protein T05_4230 [Trichinella murrelli]|uniref:Uncharacterized protein n=1 Tax=Trichinella murrelli TaxID=144512 RepID=A0A0V0T3U2_9BILA|nr:hypothetical protein T05_4230 [Trichinella murrelli]
MRTWYLSHDPVYSVEGEGRKCLAEFDDSGPYGRTSLNVLQEAGPTIHTDLLGESGCRRTLRWCIHRSKSGKRTDTHVDISGGTTLKVSACTDLQSCVSRLNCSHFLAMSTVTMHSQINRASAPREAGKEAGRPTVGVDGVQGVPSAQVGWQRALFAQCNLNGKWSAQGTGCHRKTMGNYWER